jgi:hypothetical protein
MKADLEWVIKKWNDWQETEDSHSIAGSGYYGPKTVAILFASYCMARLHEEEIASQVPVKK